MISRQRFLKQMSGHYSFHLYMRRPIRVLLDAIPCEPLRLPADYPIGLAAGAALNRPAELAYEPIVVVHSAGGPFSWLVANERPQLVKAIVNVEGGGAPFTPGTPWGITVDHQTMEDQTVTLRDRDSLTQDRIAIDELGPELEKRLKGPWTTPKLGGEAQAA